jgi:hypothetical protein
VHRRREDRTPGLAENMLIAVPVIEQYAVV